jgi:hypothetical protein
VGIVGMGIVGMGIVAAILVLGFGLLIFFLMRRSQRVVPDVAEREAAQRDRAVAVDDQGQAIAESQEAGDEAPRDDDAFEAVLHEELDDLGR